jgi:NAD(P)-dependent dehydrogenase (short-subunit alcohol dehydrogenase family)
LENCKLIDVVLQLQINNAGIANANKDVTFETVKPVLNTNYFGVKNVTKALLPLLRDDTPGGARVIVVASTVGQLKVMSLGIPTPHQLISGHLICSEILSLFQMDRSAGRIKFSKFGMPCLTSRIRKTL